MSAFSFVSPNKLAAFICLPLILIITNQSYGNTVSDSLEIADSLSTVHQLNFVDTLAHQTNSTELKSNASTVVGGVSFNSGMINDPLGFIEGRAAGASINKAGGDRNKNYDARIRGMSSIYGSNFPLIIIDGVLDAQLENLDPNDIESFEVVRDVAANAIYGIRGSKGVIIIKTKRGQSGKAKVSYNGYINVENAIRKHDVMSESEFERFSNKLDVMDNQFGSDTKWYDEVLQTGFSQVHNLSVSGGNPNSKYYASVNYRGVAGVLKRTGFDRLNARINLEQKALNDKLSVGLSFSGTQDKAVLGQTEAFKYAAIYNPTAPITSDEQEFDQYGGYFQYLLFDNYNPVAMIEQNEHNVSSSLLNLSISAQYELLQNLQLKLLYANQTGTVNTNLYFSKKSLWEGLSRNGHAEKETDVSGFQLIQPSLHWQPTIGSSLINVEGGYSYQEYSSEGLSATGGDFITDAFTYNNLSAAEDFSNGIGEVESYKYTNKIIGFYGRLDYNLEDTYFLSMVGRYDGSTRFGRNEKYGFYPGISVGVDIASFLSRNKIDLLKFRMGYGKSGQDIHANYVSQELWDAVGPDMYYNGNYLPGYSQVNIANPDLHSPTKTEFNFGIDYSFLNNRISGSFDLFTNKTIDLLLLYYADFNQYIWPYQAPIIADHWENGGELKNKGWELCISALVLQRSNFSYQTDLILSRYIETSYGSLSVLEKGLAWEERWLNTVGKNYMGIEKMDENTKVGEFWGLEFEYFTNDGEWKYKDLNGNGYADHEDRIKIGDGLPDLELGWANNIIYENWNFHLFFKGAFGYQLINEYRLVYEQPNFIYGYNLSKRVHDMKSPDGTYVGWNSDYNTYYSDKGNYFKLANFRIGYNFKLKETSALQNLNLYLMGQNLFVITNYKGSDPEVRYNTDTNVYRGAGLTSPGVNNTSDWLMTRSFALGLNVSF